ncbi:MAG: Tn3 family transposase [Mycobacterium sp.]|nr:Tn3 family transposase [Mycobacterium sp.]
MLLEVQGWTDFASDFTHVNQHGARTHDLPISVCAVLLAEACNVGLEPLVRPEMPALTRARLAWTSRAIFVPTRSRPPTPPRRRPRRAPDDQGFWVAGNWLRPTGFALLFPSARYTRARNPKYFGPGKGVTHINYSSAGSIGFFGFRRASHVARLDGHPGRQASSPTSSRKASAKRVAIRSSSPAVTHR